MENIKEKLPFIIGVIILIAICALAIYMFEYKRFDYYTQIDNTKIEKISTADNMKYEYELDCFSKSGIKKQIKFKTSRELREGAYLKLIVNALTGVNSWEEVELNELPNKVKEKYN